MGWKAKIEDESILIMEQKVYSAIWLSVPSDEGEKWQMACAKLHYGVSHQQPMWFHQNTITFSHNFSNLVDFADSFVLRRSNMISVSLISISTHATRSLTSLSTLHDALDGSSSKV